MRVRKAVITIAGMGTRLLPVTKEMPKEMLPVFIRGSNGDLVVKPVLQLIFEQLYRNGFREFCFIVGRGKRAVEDHFTPDWGFVDKLEAKGKHSLVNGLREFYEMVEDSIIVWVNQPEPKGFGHAVYMAGSFVGDEPFLVSAGDTYIISPMDRHVRRLVEVFFEMDAGATLLLQKVKDPRMYGIADGEILSDEELLRVSRVVEKPTRPSTNIAIMPLYVFKPAVMGEINGLEPGVGGEIQLTDAIQGLINKGEKVVGVLLGDGDIRLDIGTPATYWEALHVSYGYAAGLEGIG
jgi:UTP--glucose-1-phosphate uridylyltransferase